MNRFLNRTSVYKEFYKKNQFPSIRDGEHRFPTLHYDHACRINHPGGVGTASLVLLYI